MPRLVCILSILACLLPLGLELPAALLRPMWQDEIFGFDQTVFVPWSQLLGEWQIANHHVLWHAASKAFCGFLGITDSVDVLTSPWPPRLLALLFAVGAAVYLWRAARLVAGPTAGWLAMGFAVTGLPFVHFATQARGYSLGLLCIAACVAHGLSHLAIGRRRDLAATLLWSTGAIYTTLATGYALAGVMAGLAWMWWRGHRRHRTRARSVLCAAIAGVGLAALLMAPMWPSILAYPGMKSDGLFRTATLTQTLPAVVRALFAAAPWVALVVLLGLAQRRSRHWVAVAVTTCLLPVALSYVRGDRTFERVFLFVLPMLTLALACSVRPLQRRLRRPMRPAATRWPLAAGMTALAIGGVISIAARDRQLATTNDHGPLVQGIAAGFYQHGYDPLQRLLAARASGLPVFVGRHDGYALARYCDLLPGFKQTLLAFDLENPPAEQALILTRAPQSVAAELRRRGRQVECISPAGASHGLLRLAANLADTQRAATPR